MANARWMILVDSELVVIAQDPEMADIDNPRGDIIRPKWFVMAEDLEGYRRVLTGVDFDDKVGAEKFAATYDGWAPDNEIVWADFQPAYGSRAYVVENVEADVIAWEREQEGFY